MNYSKAHFIGIAGKGMSAVALLLRQMGVRITGSDEGFYPPVSDYLKNANIPFAAGYRKENLPDDADVIVIGKNAKLVPESNEEVRAAMESGKPVRSFADLLHLAGLVPARCKQGPKLFHRRDHQRARTARPPRQGNDLCP
jgi:UDP-N-acetylmuramate: L-alanyl-gamma-D-glutamyl-meso-diaminopimelate ligase